jgi:hypothetical protein
MAASAHPLMKSCMRVSLKIEFQRPTAPRVALPARIETSMPHRRKLILIDRSIKNR